MRTSQICSFVNKKIFITTEAHSCFLPYCLVQEKSSASLSYSSNYFLGSKGRNRFKNFQNFWSSYYCKKVTIDDKGTYIIGNRAIFEVIGDEMIPLVVTCMTSYGKNIILKKNNLKDVPIYSWINRLLKNETHVEQISTDHIEKLCFVFSEVPKFNTLKELGDFYESQAYTVLNSVLKAEEVPEITEIVETEVFEVSEEREETFILLESTHTIEQPVITELASTDFIF